MKNVKKALKIFLNFRLFFLLNLFSLIQIYEPLPKISSLNQNIKKKSVNNSNIDGFINPNLSQCFIIMNDTTILKSEFFYSTDFKKELCTKLAVSLKYKEDIYFPKFFHKCFPLCNSCTSYSIKSTEMNCISCLKGFKLKNGNCYIDKHYKEKKRKEELSIIFNTLNINKKINSNDIKKKYINGTTYLFKENIKNQNRNSNKRRKLAIQNEYDDFSNNIFNRESQTSLTNDKTNCEYNFHIELSPYYTLAEICISKGKYYIENNRCVESCTPQLETYFNYSVIEIKVGPGNQVTVCDCAFRCCIKNTNKLAKSLDRGYTDGSFQYFRRNDGKCLNLGGISYYDQNRQNSYLLAQDFVPCFFPIYNDLNEIEFYISGYEKTIVGNNCESRCPIDDPDQFYYYNSINSGCYKCPKNCIECSNIPTLENGYCIKCKEGYNIIYKGFCYDICPLYLGEDSGSCRECYSNEIIIEGKCVIYNGDSFNYGSETNPSFKDENDNVPKIFHKCVEYIGNFIYFMAKNNELCTNVICPDNYYESSDEKCEKCPKGCKDCLMDEYNNIKCTTCIEGYNLEISEQKCKEGACIYFAVIAGVTKCFSDKCPDESVFLERNNEIGSFECIESCITSEDRYFNTLSKKCVKVCNGDDSSIIEPENLCLDKCNDNYPENLDGVCENCALNSKYNHNGVCVIKDEYFDEIYYILSGEENEKYGKVGSCYIIDKMGDYHPEHIKSREYDPNLCPNDCPTNFQKKIDQNGEIFCVKCYKTCETCEHTGVAGNHKCTKCKNGYEFSQKLYGVCEKICKEGEYIYFNEYSERICTEKCPDHLPYISEIDNENENSFFFECISSCEINNQILIQNTFTCVDECPDGFFLFNYNLCVEECPNNYGTFGNSIECIICTEQNLYYYNGKCYNVEEEIPKDTYIPDNEDIPNSENPIPGVDNDGNLHECFENEIEGGSIITGYFAKINHCSRICPEDYYYDEDEKKCIKCEDFCLYCEETEGCSDECPDDYYLIYLDMSEKCVSFCPNYIPVIDVDNVCIDECYNDYNKILFSVDENTGVENYKCIEEKCKEFSLFFFDQTCYPPHKIPINTYFNSDEQNGEENILSPCINKISDNEYSTGFFYSISNCEVQCPDYFFYSGNNKCKKCHSLCKTCFAEGTNRENNCLSCIDTENRILNPYLFNCEKKCEGSFHYSEETKKIVCDDGCPKDNYIDEETGECISKCDKLIDSNYCVNECPEGKTEFNGYCLLNVVIPTVVVTKTITIPIENIPISSNSDISENKEKEENKERDENKDNNKELMESINKIQMNITNININDFSYNLVTKNGNISLCEFYITNSRINCGNSENILDLEECSEKISKYYPLDSKFYFMQVDLNEKEKEAENQKSFSSQIKYKIYRTNGDEVDINEICKNTSIKIEKSLKINNKSNKEEIIKLLEEGVNVFDINDPFFNDICYPYQDENGNDIPLQSRKEDFYQDTAICIKGCEYSGIDKNTSKVMCNCNADALVINKDEDDETILGYLDDSNLNNFIDKIASSDTISVVKCYEKTFKKENIKKNIGFWIYFGFLSLFLLLLAGLLCYRYNSLNTYLLQFEKEKNMENEVIEDEEQIVTKKVIVSSNSNNIENENISSNENSNPPKRTSNEDKISEEKTRTKTKEKITFGFENKYKEYPKLNISNFGKGYKLSNKFDAETIDDYQTLTKLSDNKHRECEIISKKTSENNIRENSPSSSSFINNKISKRHYRGSKVELEPEGALLAANNFFDTCRIVKIPNNLSEKEFKYEKNIVNENYKSNINKNMKNYSNSNSLNISNFYQTNKKVVNLPGFPDPKYEKEIFSELEKKKIKTPSSYSSNNVSILNKRNLKYEERNKENPLNRQNNDTIYSNELEDMDEKYNDSSFFDREISRNKNNKNYNYNKYNKNYIRSSLSKYGANPYTKQPITINKYYITNNSNDDNYKETLRKINEKDSKEEYEKIGKTKFYSPDSEKINWEERQRKSKIKKSKNNKNSEKIITTITTKKSKKNYRFEKKGAINSDLDNADFEEVMLNDHRSFCGIFCSFLSNFQIYVSICFSDNIYVPWIIRASICLFTLELFFTFTALVMKISQFEKRYKSKKDIDILYLIQNEFTNIIYTTLITKIMNFVAMYIFVHYSVSKVIRDYAYQGEIFILELNKALYRLKCKYFIFVIIFIILTCLQGYFISCFCAVYVGSIKEWIYSSLIAFVFNLILSFLFIFLAALFRAISICCQSWLLFMISNFFLSFA